MLNRLNRIGDSATIEELRKAGKVFKTPPLLFRYEEAKAKSRFSVTVSSRVSKTAVGRNRLRRQIYEAVRIHLHEIGRPVTATISAREYLANHPISFRELEKTVLEFIHHLKSHAK